jgi:hypothetical protein
VWGGEPATVSADELIADWRGFVDGLSATQHITGPILASDGQLHTHVVGHHWHGDDIWSVHGHYVARVAGGRITELTLQTFHQEGNRELPTLAAGWTPVAQG